MTDTGVGPTEWVLSLRVQKGMLGKMKKQEGALGSREAGLVFLDTEGRHAPESHVSWGSRQSSGPAAKEIQA